MTSFNGYKNWAHWNVSLWVNNEENLYRMARSMARRHKNKNEAAECLRVLFLDLGMAQTPDGAKFSRAALRAAISDI